MHGCLLPATPGPPLPPPGAPAPILPPCEVTVLVGKLPAARMTDLATAAPPHPIIKGSGTVLIGKLPAARLMDNCACGGFIIKGEFTVLTGG
ncbi:PAAR domain-containing protein [Actibacterium pelagium]|uniref:PAAR domain-containing protein n=1 Tax=Actibacterium pelagium TaxID=2029103 RepID=UPI001E4316C6|nr:PAAR domain-containing protein [Actibacterium pelagium]